MIAACSRTLKTLFYQPRSGVSQYHTRLMRPADVTLEEDVDIDLYDLSKRLLLEKIETVVCSKTSAPSVHLDHLTPKISPPNPRDLVITHGHDLRDLFSILSATTEKVTRNLSTRRNGAPNTSITRLKVTFNVGDPLWL